MTTDETPPFRLLPRLTDLNRPFWTGGEQGELRFLRCGDCGTRIHPPVGVCYQDHSKNVAPEAVSGRAKVATYTVNHQMWMPGPELPYVVAIVEIEEDPTIRLTTNIVGCAPEDVYIGMPVEVVFEKQPDGEDVIWIPLFRPAGGEA
ncbi:MAG: Zn-ribbon domain-containing OB-fold protein [Candidatus Binatia bacterium]|nr:Zn-ribbon domain-containing OB-fold protein [Candidatus Binatia bacterium]